MRKIILTGSLLLLSVIVMAQVSMTGRKTQLIFGDVSKVVCSNGKFIEFNKDGNIVKINPYDSTDEYSYESATRYILHGGYYDIIFKDNVRIEKFDNPDEYIGVNYTFDSLGRIKNMSRRFSDYEPPLVIDYFYNGNELLPFKIVEPNDWEGGSSTTTSLYTYTKVDENGNWLACDVKVEYKVEEYGEKPSKKVEQLSLSREISYYSESELSKKEVYTAKNAAPTPSIAEKPAAQNKERKKIDWEELLGQIAVGLVLLLIIGHMVYIKFVRGQRYKIVYTPEDFKQIRTSKGLNESASEEEEREARLLLEQAFSGWPIVEETETETLCKPKRMRQINSAAAFINQAIAIAPTSNEVVDRINDLTDVVNSNEKRVFFGSKPLIVVAAIVGILLWYMLGYTIGLLSVFGIAIYILASQAPVFLVDKRIEKKRGSLSAGVFAGVAAMITGAKTIRTTTTWSDGSKTVDDDHSQHWFALIFGIVILFILGVYISAWALVNYLRNYVLYI